MGVAVAKAVTARKTVVLALMPPSTVDGFWCVNAPIIAADGSCCVLAAAR